MQSSNLAVRMERAEELEDQELPRVVAEAAALELRAAQRRVRVRKSFEYRAIVIRDEPRLFRVR